MDWIWHPQVTFVIGMALPILLLQPCCKQGVLGRTYRTSSTRVEARLCSFVSSESMLQKTESKLAHLELTVEGAAASPPQHATELKPPVHRDWKFLEYTPNMRESH